MLSVLLGLAVIFTLATATVLGMLGVLVPRLLTRQGVAADASALTLVQDAKWWFAGRRLRLPWPDVQSATSTGTHRSRRVPRTPNVVLRLSAIPPQARVPHWAILVRAHAAPPSGGTKSSVPRLFLTLPWDDHDAFLRLANEARPAPDRPGPTPRTGAGSHPEPRDWLPLRTTRLTQWGAYCVLAVGGPLVMPVIDLVQRLRGGEGLPAPVVLPMTAAALCGLLLMVALAPRFWTRQGLDRTEEHLRIAQRPMWWHRGRSADIPWRDIRRIVPGEHPVRESPVLEIFLSRVERDLRMPRWARLVLPGEELWGRAASQPRVVLDLTDTAAHNTVESMLRHVRPDLFEHPAPARPGSPAASAPAGSATPAGQAGAHWVNVRGRRIFGWSMGMLTLCVSSAVLVSAEMSTARGGADPMAVSVLWESVGVVACTVLLGVWLVCVAMPRLFAHQGVAIGDEGLTLVQEPLLWFAGRTTHIPWSQLHEVRPGRAMTLDSLFRTRDLSPDSVVDLVPHDPDAITRAPSWVRIHPREPRFALPWRPRRDRVRLCPGHHRASQVMQAIRAVRPDLLRAARGRTRSGRRASGAGRRSAAP